MPSCFCHNLCAQDHCLLAHGAFCVPPISALWRKERRASTNAKWTKTWRTPRSSSPNECFSPLPKLNPWDAEGNAWPSRWQSQGGLHVNENGKESDRDGLHLRGAHPEGHVPHYRCLERGVSFCRRSLVCVFHLQQVREGGRSLWHDLQWSEHVGNCWRLGAEPMPKREKHMPRNQPWNATWHQLDWACREPQ